MADLLRCGIDAIASHLSTDIDVFGRDVLMKHGKQARGITKRGMLMGM